MEFTTSQGLTRLFSDGHEFLRLGGMREVMLECGVGGWVLQTRLRGLGGWNYTQLQGISLVHLRGQPQLLGWSEGDLQLPGNCKI